MEGKKKQGINSGSSSFTAELFGVNDASTDPQSTGIFASIFPPPSKGRNSADVGSWQKHQGSTTKHGSSAIGGEGGRYNKERNLTPPEQNLEPCHLSSSLYYGGQDVYSRSPTNHTSPNYPPIKDTGEVDSNGNNSTDASRGNWWQGSLYY